MKQHQGRFAVLFVLLLQLVADRALAFIAVDLNAAGALLSPGGSLDLGALAVAAMFFFNRLLLALLFALTVGSAAAAVTGWLFRRRATAPPS